MADPSYRSSVAPWGTGTPTPPRPRHLPLPLFDAPLFFANAAVLRDQVVRLVLARVRSSLRTTLRRLDPEDRLGPENIHLSVRGAVRGATGQGAGSARVPEPRTAEASSVVGEDEADAAPERFRDRPIWGQTTSRPGIGHWAMLPSGCDSSMPPPEDVAPAGASSMSMRMSQNAARA